MVGAQLTGVLSVTVAKPSNEFERPPLAFTVLAAMALVKLIIHFSLNSYYGFQRDELYFIACGEHLAWGYVDIGPLAMWLGRLSREVLGDSLFAFRFFPAIAGTVTVFLTGMVARELGGKRFAQGLAALSVLIAPVWLMAGNILSLPSFEPLFWTLAAYLVLRLIHTGNLRLWLWIGVVIGFGFLNKPSMLFWVLALGVGLALTPHRRYFLDNVYNISLFMVSSNTSCVILFCTLENGS